MAASEREAALLARVAANHLFLAQFEPLRATLLSLRRRADPELAAGFLRAVVAAGGRVPGVLWSAPPACPSPSHLAWLAALELAALPSTPNPEALRLKAEFLVLLQPIADDPATGAEARGTLARLLDFGVSRLRREVEGGGEVGAGAEDALVTEEDLRELWGVFLDNALDSSKKEKELQAKEAELNKRERELKRREEAASRAGIVIEEKNWPPFFPIIHHDISNEIPIHLQRMQYLAFSSLLGKYWLLVALLLR
ncbi:hypothetical protein EJB05_16165, partial [Eragrostis curvula]